jgi:hypothetical protein
MHERHALTLNHRPTNRGLAVDPAVCNSSHLHNRPATPQEALCLGLQALGLKACPAALAAAGLATAAPPYTQHIVPHSSWHIVLTTLVLPGIANSSCCRLDCCCLYQEAQVVLVLSISREQLWQLRICPVCVGQEHRQEGQIVSG